MSSTTIRVATKTHALLNSLAREVGVSMQEVVDAAVENYHRQHILKLANAEFAAYRAQAASAEELHESLLWDDTLADGLEEAE